MAVNQVVINGETVVDLTDTTAEADKVLDGEVFYTASGSRAVGTYIDKDHFPSAHCATKSATAAKVASCTNYTLTANTYLHFNILYANTVQGAITMNVNSKGAKPIYINGSASSSSNYTLPAGSYIAYYDGTNWYFRTDGVLPFGNSLKNDGTTTTIGTYALDAAYGKTLKDSVDLINSSINYLMLKRVGSLSTSGTSTITIRFTGTCRGLLIGLSTSTARAFMYMLSCNATTNGLIDVVSAGSSITVDKSTAGSITLTTNASGMCAVFLLAFEGGNNISVT